MAISKAAANKKYDELRAKLKSGDITKEAFKTASARIYNMYHSDSNKATRNAAPSKPKPKATAKPKPKAPAKPKPKTAKESLYQSGQRYGGGPIKPRAQRVLEIGGSDVKPGDGTSRRGRTHTGTLPGTPKPKKPTSNSQRNRSNRGSGVKGRQPKVTPRKQTKRTNRRGRRV
jgi:hypothetical protein